MYSIPSETTRRALDDHCEARICGRANLPGNAPARRLSPGIRARKSNSFAEMNRRIQALVVDAHSPAAVFLPDHNDWWCPRRDWLASDFGTDALMDFWFDCSSYLTVGEAPDRLSERPDVCRVDFVVRQTGSSDISIMFRECIDVLCDEGHQRLLVGGRVRQTIDLELVQYLLQFFFLRQPGNCSSCLDSIRRLHAWIHCCDRGLQIDHSWRTRGVYDRNATDAIDWCAHCG